MRDAYVTVESTSLKCPKIWSNRSTRHDTALRAPSSCRAGVGVGVRAAGVIAQGERGTACVCAAKEKHARKRDTGPGTYVE